MFDIHPEIEGLTLFAAEPGLHVHDIHSHGAHSIIVVTSGVKIFHHGARSVRVASGEIAISNPGDLHGCEPADQTPWSHRTWYVDPALMAEIARGLGMTGDVRLSAPIVRDGDIADALNEAHAEARRGDVLNRQSVAFDALRALVGRHARTDARDEEPSGANSDRRMVLYEELLDDESSASLTLDDLADRASVSRNQVIRDFKAVHGTTPGAYRRHLRLEMAKSRLREGRTLAEVSTLAGFADQSHFIRVFKGAYGVIPSSYQKLLVTTEGASTV